MKERVPPTFASRFFPALIELAMHATTLPLLLALSSATLGQNDKVTLDAFAGKVRPILAAHCGECHSATAAKIKGDFRFDALKADFSDERSRDGWRTALKRVAAGEMPPKSKPQPSAAEKQTLIDWLTAGIKAADERRATEGRVVLRRLNRIEYENTIRDLLGIHVELRDALPQDGSAGGFDNVGEALHVSPFLMERYLEAADKSLSLAIANGPRPPYKKNRYSLKETHLLKSTTEKVFRVLDDGAVIGFSSSHWNAVTLSPFYPPDRGTYRFRVSAHGVQSDGKPVVFRVDAGPLLMATRNHLVSYFDAPPEKPGLIEWTDQLEARSTIRIQPYGLANAQTVHKIGADKYEGPGLAINWVEVEGPIHDDWPPASHRRIFGDLPQAKAPAFNRSDRIEVVSKDPEADADRILLNFGRRAFRRGVTKDEIAPYLDLVKTKMAGKTSFESAVRVGLMAMLVSKDFLFLREPAGKLDDFALASRLSYFLWSTMPDDELLALAERKTLGEPATLRAQVERMLKDAKAASFTENFVGQWLGLRDIDATSPSHILYPEFDDMLKESMLRETYLFFNELLKNDLSVTNFVASDFTMLNGRLAKHYRIPGVDGWEFKKTPLPEGSHRGGVLTMASVLTVTANGTYTSPILRGAWVLDRLLGQPPPRPPEGVSAVEPDIRGATTIRQQLAKHRQNEACASCHVRIDPPGFALENFDVIGGWREHYRTSGNGKPVMIEGRRMPYLQGPAVDAGDVYDGLKFGNVDEFKQILLKNKDQIARNLASRLVTYSTGAAVQPGDQKAIDAIVERNRAANYGLKNLVHEIVQSDVFRRK